MTLVETMVCVLIIAVLASLAAPAFRDLLRRQRVATVRSELTTALQLARWEALRRNGDVALQRRSDCSALLRTSHDWHCGWEVIASTNDQPQVLQTFVLPPGVNLQHPNGGSILGFGRGGMPALVAHRFVIAADGAASIVTALCMNRTGRIRTVAGQSTC